MNEVRAERIWKDLDGFKDDSKQDPVLIMLTEWYDEFGMYSKNGGHIEFQHFQREVSIPMVSVLFSIILLIKLLSNSILQSS